MSKKVKIVSPQITVGDAEMKEGWVKVNKQTGRQRPCVSTTDIHHNMEEGRRQER